MEVITKLILCINLAIENIIKLFPIYTTREYCQRKKAENIFKK